MTLDEIYDEREVNKVSLETYFFNFKQDSFSDSVDNHIQTLEKEFEESWKLYLEGKHIQNHQIGNWYFSHDLLREKLLATAEMKVVYRFRNLEIDIKKLLKVTYNLDPKDLYKWENINGFLKTKQILLSEIKGYQEVNQLREMNNFLKHSADLKSLKIAIPEFKDKKELSHTELLMFYKRVKDSCDSFLIDLSQKIYDDLYVFEDSKLEKMSLDLALRMTKDQAMLLIQKLQSKY